MPACTGTILAPPSDRRHANFKKFVPLHPIANPPRNLLASHCSLPAPTSDLGSHLQLSRLNKPNTANTPNEVNIMGLRVNLAQR